MRTQYSKIDQKFPPVELGTLFMLVQNLVKFWESFDPTVREAYVQQAIDLLTDMRLKMAKTPEGDVKDDVKDYLTKRGAYFFMPVVTSYGKRGVDFFVCLQGKFIAIETKGNKPEPTEAQKEVLKAVAAAGGLALWANDADYIIRQIEKRIPS